MKKYGRVLDGIGYALMLVIIILSFCTFAVQSYFLFRGIILDKYDFFGNDVHYVNTNIFSPEIEKNSFVFISLAPETVVENDIIVFKNENTSYLGRVNEVLFSDNQKYVRVSSSFGTSLINYSNVVGLYTKNATSFTSFVNFTNSTAGFIAFLILPITVYISFEIVVSIKRKKIKLQNSIVNIETNSQKNIEKPILEKSTVTNMPIETSKKEKNDQEEDFIKQLLKPKPITNTKKNTKKSASKITSNKKTSTTTKKNNNKKKNLSKKASSTAKNTSTKKNSKKDVKE